MDKTPKNSSGIQITIRLVSVFFVSSIKRQVLLAVFFGEVALKMIIIEIIDYWINSCSNLKSLSVFVTYWWILVERIHMMWLVHVLTVSSTTRILSQVIFKMFQNRVPFTVYITQISLPSELLSPVFSMKITSGKSMYSQSESRYC